MLGLQICAAIPSMYVGAGDWKTGSNACITNKSLLTEPRPPYPQHQDFYDTRLSENTFFFLHHIILNTHFFRLPTKSVVEIRCLYYVLIDLNYFNIGLQAK